MSSQKLRRLPGGRYIIYDHELALVCTEGTCLKSPELTGIAFKTASAGWRCLARGLADIGNRPTMDEAVERILEHADAIKPQPADIGPLSEAVKKALPL